MIIDASFTGLRGACIAASDTAGFALDPLALATLDQSLPSGSDQRVSVPIHIPNRYFGVRITGLYPAEKIGNC